MWTADKWTDYRLLDCESGEKLEYWGRYLLRRPEPQAVWRGRTSAMWEKADAWYHRSPKGGGSWEYIKKLPDKWNIKYKDLTFVIKPMGFKHTGLFPEQAVNWDWFSAVIKSARAARPERPVRILNLFAYTGGATAAALAAGAEVCHVDASKGMVAQAKENVLASGLSDRPVRYIVDDVKKFVAREGRRARQYDAVIMDPPSYGRGPSGELWKIEDELYPLIEDCMKILSKKPLFFLINSYTTGLSPAIMKIITERTLTARFGGSAECDEIGIPVSDSDLVLPCGMSARWMSGDAIRFLSGYGED